MVSILARYTNKKEFQELYRVIGLVIDTFTNGGKRHVKILGLRELIFMEERGIAQLLH